jgi:hypothetical protein
MDRLEIHTLICKKDIEWFFKTFNLFKFHSKLDCDVIIHEDGSMDDEDVNVLLKNIENCEVIRRERAENEMVDFLKDYEICSHFRFASHHTIFKIKLFDLFHFTKSNNILYMDADILFCKEPTTLKELIENKVGFYLKDKWSSYCVPFRDEDNCDYVDRFINAGLNYYPTKNHYNLKYVEEALGILYNHGSRWATHPFLEQSAIAYMITKLIKDGISFQQLPEPEYCIPTFNSFIPEHNLTALHLNSSPLVGKWKEEHYEYELKKISIYK